jgi:recombination protein RecR
VKLARPLQNLIDAFERLPGIGPKSAQRLAFYLLHVPQQELENFADALVSLKKNTVECHTCFNISETNPCMICDEPKRDKSVICIVEQAIDILAIEKAGKFDGVYHVLHGRIDPLNNIRPEDLRIEQLVKRVKAGNPVITEIIFALNPDMEGEATSMYIVKKLRVPNTELKITRLAYGLPTGASIEYADEITLGRALEGRRDY